jgi:enoyl-CoA hydratase
LQPFARVTRTGSSRAVRRRPSPRPGIQALTPDPTVSMSAESVAVAVVDGVATITLNRPDKLNALDSAMLDELDNAIGDLVSREEVGGAILTGAGRAFVAGADISALAQLTPVDAQQFALRGQELFTRIERCGKPIIAAVNGFALGGGCELAMACHVRVASDGARFGQPEVKLGTIPGYGGTQRLPRLVGRGRALQLLLTGEMIDAAEAYRIGLVNRVVPAAELLPAADALLRQMLANAPLALSACIDAVNQGLPLPLDDAMALEAGLFAMLAGTRDMAEGASAFVEKRPARFSGR